MSLYSRFYVLKDGKVVSKAYQTRGGAKGNITRKQRHHDFTNRVRANRGEAPLPPLTGYGVREVQYVFNQEIDTPIC